MSTRRMAFAGGVYAANSGFSHRNDPEVLLIRVSHWLWKWWRASRRQDRSLEAAIEAMAAVKEAYRAPVRASRAERDDRLRQIRRSRGMSGFPELPQGTFSDSVAPNAPRAGSWLFCQSPGANPAILRTGEDLAKLSGSGARRPRNDNLVYRGTDLVYHLGQG
jgi:hypothetical protein